MHVVCAVEHHQVAHAILYSQAFSCQMECHVKQMEYVRMYAIEYRVYVVDRQI